MTFNCQNPAGRDGDGDDRTLTMGRVIERAFVGSWRSMDKLLSSQHVARRCVILFDLKLTELT